MSILSADDARNLLPIPDVAGILDQIGVAIREAASKGKLAVDVHSLIPRWETWDTSRRATAHKEVCTRLRDLGYEVRQEDGGHASHAFTTVSWSIKR